MAVPRWVPRRERGEREERERREREEREREGEREKEKRHCKIGFFIMED